MGGGPSDLVVIRTFQVEHHAELARAVLEANGIGAVVLRDNAGGMLPVLQVHFPIRLAVPVRDAEQALALLDAEAADWSLEELGDDDEEERRW